MRAAGASAEDIARVLVPMRNAAKVATRGPAPPEKVAEWEARNMLKYNDPVGPTADYQFNKYGSWEEVIKAAYRTDPVTDAAAGLAPQPPADPEPPTDPEPPVDPLP